MRVDIAWGKTPKLSQPKLLVKASDHNLVFANHYSEQTAITISPDGTYFVVGQKVDGNSAQRLLYIDHWSPELSTNQ